jgi:glutamine amidotransferase
MNVVILDYGSANYHSIVNFLNFSENLNVKISYKKTDIKNSDLLIFPGVGTFDQALHNIKKRKIDKILKKEIRQGKLVLGICLGMQILFEFSDESKCNQIGLSLIKGKTKKLNITNVGWRKLIINKKKFKYFNNLSFYFNHSYFQICEKKNVLAYVKFSKLKIPAIIKKNNIWGVQFHPENSQLNGKIFIRSIFNQI